MEREKEMSYRSAFPYYDGEFYCPKGWFDGSYKNDTMPRAMKWFETESVQIDFSIWQNYVDVNKREYNGKRYLFHVEVDDEVIYSYETDELSEIERLVGKVNHMIKGIVFEHGDDDWSVWITDKMSDEDQAKIKEIMAKYENDGCSIKGKSVREDIERMMQE